MFVPYRKLPSSNTHTSRQKTSNHTKRDPKLTSNDLKMTSNEKDRKTKSKGNLRGGDPNDDGFNNRRDLIEQGFSSP